MGQLILSWLGSDSAFTVQIAVIALLLLGGIGFPVPEDIPILLGGVAASKEIITPQMIFLTSYVGVLAADQIVFFIGFFFGKKLIAAGTKSKFFPQITEARVEEVREGLRKRRLLFIFMGRHLFPIRSVTFITAGALHVPWIEFFIADALAAFVSVSLMTALGYYLGSQITPEILHHIAHEARIYILVLATLIIIGLLIRQQRKKKSAAN